MHFPCFGRFAILAAACVLVGARAASAEDRSHPVVLSLFQPASTSPDPDVRTNFRLNLIYGHVREVSGVDFGGFVARTSGDSRSLRITLLGSIVAGEFRGLGVTGLLDYVEGDVHGFQFSGLVNYDRMDASGLQAAGLFNFVEGTAAGLQFSGVFNLADAAGALGQFSGIANAVAGGLTGVQLSGGINFVGEDLKGVQGGLMNFAAGFRGVQIGGFNSSREAHGPQIGLVNIARENRSVPIGLASFSDDSNTDWITEASTLVGISTGIRTNVNSWRASLMVGGTSVSDEDAKVVAFSWLWGREFRLARRLVIVPDVGFVHLTYKDAVEGADEKRPAGQARVLFEFRIGPRFAIYAGGGASLVFSSYNSGADSEVEGLGVLGVSLF